MLDQKFSRYEIREELGMGGMATVYRAYDPLFERDVALKILKRELLQDSQLKERFERETKIIARLEHSAIVPVHDVGYDNGQLFYVMRYMSGGSLSERIEGGLSLGEIAFIMIRMAAALDYAHGKGIVHRDLKPGNILFDENNNPYISDFGIAKVTESATKITSSGIIGTPRYMSPEQARGDAADGRSDQYSLAIILFEMLSGKSPFEATTPLAMAFKHATELPPSILKINPNLPEGIAAILEKALAKQPDDRYGTCVEFTNAFLEVFPEASSPEANFITPTPPRLRKNPEAATQLPLNPVPVPPPKSDSRVWMIGGFVTLALIVFGMWGYPRLTATTGVSTFTPEAATATLAVSTPTALPTETPAPTETIAATIPPVPVGIGGSDKIAVTANDDIYLMDIDGKNIKQLTNTNLPKFDLQWLPGGDELLYAEGRCVYRLNVSASQINPESIVCFTDSKLDGFRVSPDGKNVAVSIEHRLIVMPFDLDLLKTSTSVFGLQSLKEACLDYAEVSVKGALWSANGVSLAILYQSVIGQRIGDTIRIMDVDLKRCKDIDPLVIDDLPGKHFVPDGYKAYPILPAYSWDGNQQILFNTFKRNAGYGELYLYDIATASVRKLNPVNGVCCYRDSIFSPDGKYVLVFFQDENRGADSETQMYYLPVDQIGSTTFTPVKLPLRFFPNPRENIEVALRPAIP